MLLSAFQTFGPVMLAAKIILFEQPANQHTRIWLRLEHLFQKIQQYFHGESIWHSRMTLEALLEIMTILERPDIKSVFSKELLRHAANLTRLQQLPNVDHSKLQHILNELNELNGLLNSVSGKFATLLRENEFLLNIRQHLANPGGACDFENPAYYLWLQQPFTLRHKHLVGWLDELTVINRIVRLFLKLIRESTPAEPKTANQGFYQMTLDPKSPCQLIRVTLTADMLIYPEISAGPHRVCIRFLRSDFQGRSQQITQNLQFKLACCIL